MRLVSAMFIISLAVVATSLSIMSYLHYTQSPLTFPYCPMCQVSMIGSGPLLMVGLVVGTLGAIASLVALMVSKSSNGNENLKRLSDEERAALIIRRRGEITQSELKKTLGISRVRAHRIVKRLEAKGMIEGEKRGKTRLLRWKETSD